LPHKGRGTDEKIGSQCVNVFTVSFRHARGCYDWRADLDLGLHFCTLGIHIEDRRGEMKGWKSIMDCLLLDAENVLFLIGCL